MLDSRKVGLLGLLLASYLLISPRVAHAQFPEGENKWAVMDVTAAIDRAIEESKEGIELREKVVRRFSECSLMYGGLSTLASNAEARKSYVQAQLATMEIESTVAKPLQSEKRLEIEEAARKSVAVMLRALNAQRDKDKEVGPLLRNCKAINDTKEIKNAVRELSLQ
jgi:vacuolar-type H+-ATPase subunit I/STV1